MRKSELQRELKEQARKKLRRAILPVSIIVISFIITAFCFVTFGAPKNPVNVISDKVKIFKESTTDQGGDIPQSGVCSDLVMRCEMEAILEKSPCEREWLETELKKRLADPLQNDSCKKIIDGFGEMCPENCVIDLVGLTMIPGSVDIKFQDYDSKCRANASRSVTLRAPCREKKIKESARINI
jgi:hypothetical protein